MELTRERALELHRQMWTNMQMTLGDNPNSHEREKFKRKWCKEHFPTEIIDAHCFLCEYVDTHEDDCAYCPIKWSDNHNDDNCCGDDVSYEFSPISVILALPERKYKNNNENELVSSLRTK